MSTPVFAAGESTTERWIASLSLPSVEEGQVFGTAPRRAGFLFTVDIDRYPRRGWLLADYVQSRIWDRLQETVGVDEWIALDGAQVESDGIEKTTRDAGVRDVVHVVLEEEEGKIALQVVQRRGHLYFWERLLGLNVVVGERQRVSIGMDAELRGLMLGKAPAPARLRPRLTALSIAGRAIKVDGLGSPLDLGVHDLNGDGLGEILLLFPDDLVVIGGHDGRASTWSLKGLRPSPGKARVPIGTLVITKKPEHGQTLWFHTSNFAGWIQVDVQPDGTVGSFVQIEEDGPYTAPFPESAEPGEDARFWVGTRIPGTDVFEPRLVLMNAPRLLAAEQVVVEPFYRYQRTLLKTAEVGEWEEWEAYAGVNGDLCVRKVGEESCRKRFKNAGTAFLLVDLDVDGRLDVIQSSAALDAETWRVVQWRDRRRTKNYRWRTSDPIAAIATNGSGSKGVPGVFVVTYSGSEGVRLWRLEGGHE